MSSFSVQVLIIEIAGNWKTDAATAPDAPFLRRERCSPAGWDSRQAQAGRDGLSVGEGRRVEGRFHGVSEGTP